MTTTILTRNVVDLIEDGCIVQSLHLSAVEHARLIACAPDLLAALEGMIAAYGNVESPALAQARAAIAKSQPGGGKS